MSELKRTELRHRMLHRVVKGHVRLTDGGWRGAPGFEIGPISIGSLTAMQNKVGIVAVVGGVSFPTDAARDLLSEWNERYGEVQP